jgi:hypothetical protein
MTASRHGAELELCIRLFDCLFLLSALLVAPRSSKLLFVVILGAVQLQFIGRHELKHFGDDTFNSDDTAGLYDADLLPAISPVSTAAAADHVSPCR